MALTREQRYENQQTRQVDFLRRVNSRDFWRSARGSFMISGGNAWSRAEQLSCWIDEYTQYDPIPVVILSGAAGFPQSFSSLVYDDYDIYYFDQDHPYYHFFYGMDVSSCSGVVLDMAKKQGVQDLQNMESFTQAFMRLTEKTYPVSLPAMLELSRFSDSELSDMARRKGLGRSDQIVLSNGGMVGTGFRNMLGNMLSWAGSLMRPECESLQNILTFVVDSTRKIEAGDMRRKVLIVNTLSRYPAFLNSSLAWEMQNLYAKGLRCAVVMDSMVFEDSDPLLKITYSHYYGGGCVGCTAYDVGAMLQDREKVSAIPVKCFLRDAGANCFSADLTDMLQNTGKYMAYQETHGVSGTMFDLPIDRHRDSRVAVQEISRLMASDVSRATAVLKGYDGEKIAVVSQLLTD